MQPSVDLRDSIAASLVWDWVVCFVLIFVWTRTSTASGVNLLVSPENRSAGSTCEQCNQLQRGEAPSRPFPTRTEPARARRASPKLRRDRIRAQNLDDNPHEALRTARAGISRGCHALLCRSIRRSNGSALADGSQSCGLPREPIAFKSCHTLGMRAACGDWRSRVVACVTSAAGKVPSRLHRSMAFDSLRATS